MELTIQQLPDAKRGISKESFYFDFHWRGRPGKSTVKIHILDFVEWKLVIFEDLGKGTSVTNASEQIATEVGKLNQLDPLRTIFLECYPYYENYDIDRITYRYSVENGYSEPEWTPVRDERIVEFIKKMIREA